MASRTGHWAPRPQLFENSLIAASCVPSIRSVCNRTVLGYVSVASFFSSRLRSLIPLSPIIPTHPSHIAVSLIIPTLTQNQGVAGGGP